MQKNSSETNKRLEHFEKKELFIQNFFHKVLLSNNLEEASFKISQELINLTGFNQSFLRLLDQEFNIFLDPQGNCCTNKKYERPTKGYYDQLEEELCEQIFEKHNPLIIDNVDKFTLSLNLQKFLQDINVKSEIIIPIYYKNQALGVFVLSTTKEYVKLDTNKKEFLKILVPVISTCINIFYINDKFKQTLLVEHSIQQITDKLKNSSDQNNFYDYILDKLIEIFAIDTACRYIFSDDKKFLKIQNLKSAFPMKQGNIYDLDIQKTFDKFHSKEIIIINNAEKELADFAYTKNYFKNININSCIIYPNLLENGSLKNNKIIGSIAIFNQKAKHWSSEEVYWLKQIIDTINTSFNEKTKRTELESFKRDFIATLTHDLKSPLLAEEKLLESILDKNPKLPLKEIFPWIEEVIKTNKELLQMISNLLSMYHTDSSKYSLNIKKIQMTQITQEVIDVLKYLSNDKKITINVEKIKNKLEIDGDRQELKRVISNLLTNAIKYTKVCGTIDIKFKIEKNEIYFSITDEGPGIEETEKKNIFNPYKSRKSTLGRGLGLYIAKQVIEAHNGTIWVENDSQKGSKFCFTIPIKQNIPLI